MRPHALFGGGGDGKDGGGLGGLGNMANIMENMKKAQGLVQTEAAKVQEDLSQYVAETLLLAHVQQLHVPTRRANRKWSRKSATQDVATPQPCDGRNSIAISHKNHVAPLFLIMSTAEVLSAVFLAHRLH